MIFTLLLVAQISHAGELCASPSASTAPAQAAAAETSGAISSPRTHCRTDPGCAEARSESPACAATGPDANSIVAGTSDFKHAVLAASAAAHSTPSIETASAAFPKLAAPSHPPLRTLFCRYLI